MIKNFENEEQEFEDEKKKPARNLPKMPGGGASLDDLPPEIADVLDKIGDLLNNLPGDFEVSMGVMNGGMADKDAVNAMARKMIGIDAIGQDGKLTDEFIEMANKELNSLDKNSQDYAMLKSTLEMLEKMSGCSILNGNDSDDDDEDDDTEDDSDEDVDDVDADDFIDEERDAPSGQSDSSEESNEPTVTLFETLVNRNNPFCDVLVTPFSRAEFEDEFDLYEEFEERKWQIDIEKFKDIMPADWVNTFKTVTLATQRITNQDNKFVFGRCVEVFDDSNVAPEDMYCGPMFAIYKNEDGEFALYIPKNGNPVEDDGTLHSFKELLGEENYETIVDMILERQRGDDGSITASAMNATSINSLLNMMNPNQANNNNQVPVGEYTKVKKGLVSFVLHTLNYDEDRVYGITDQYFTIKKVPYLSLAEAGTFIEGREYKQFENGYVYIGEIALNDDNEDVTYLLNSYDLTVHGMDDKGHIDLYVKVSNKKLPDGAVREYKKHLLQDINNEVFQKYLELNGNTKGNFLYFDLVKM